MTLPSSNSELRIVVADDHPVVLADLKALIVAAGDMIVVGEAEDWSCALRLATELQPDVMILDISLRGLDWSNGAERLCETWPLTRILMHTVHEDKDLLRQALELGVKGYMLQRSSGDDLIRAIRSVADGNLCIDPLLLDNSLAVRRSTNP